jgi:hypothetical protein
LRDNQSDDLLLCLAHGRRPGEPELEAHTFAAHRFDYFDNNTDKVDASVPSWLAAFRIVRALAVRERPK